MATSKNSKKIFYNVGFVTLEIIIALAIIVITISTITLVTFGNQSILTDSVTGSQALTLSKQMLQLSEANVQKDFKLVQPFSTTTDIYSANLDVSSPDFFTKKLTSTITWAQGTLRPQHITLQKIITDYDTDTDDTCDSTPSVTWAHIYTKNTQTDFATLISDPTHNYSISDVNAYKNKLYITTDTTSTKTDSTFFIFDITDYSHPTLLSHLDNTPTTVAGLNAVTIASSTLGSYAYVLNATQSNFATCSQGKNCAQLHIIDITSASNPILITNYKIPATTTPFVTGSNNKAVGQSIFYSNGYLYIGLSKTTTGPEFNIIDVHDPQHPQWVGGYAVGYTINKIFVKNNFAYLAHTTDNTGTPQEQLSIIDVSTPTNPHRVSGFYDTAGLFNSGRTVTVIGDAIYLGRLASRTLPGSTDSIPEFYILNGTSPTAVSLQPIGTTSLATPESLHQIIIRNTLSFFLTTSQFQVWDITTPTHIFFTASSTVPSGGATTGTMDCEKDIFYVGTNNANGKGFLTILGNTP